MQPHRSIRTILLTFFLIFLQACTFDFSLATEAVPTATAAPTQQEVSVPSPAPNSVIAAYIKSRNLYVWDSTTNQSRELANSDDVIDLRISDDGERIAFVRWAMYDQQGIQGEASLWVVDASGEHEKVLVPADSLHQRLNVSGTDLSVDIGDMLWVPHTHRLIYNEEAGDAGGDILGQAGDVYVVDADTLSDTLLAPAGNAASTADADGPWFSLSPDGTQLAMFTSTEISFVNIDGSNLRQTVLRYPPAGIGGDTLLRTTAVWAQDNSAVLLNAPLSGDATVGFSFSITRVPVDGSPAKVVVYVANSLPNTLTYAPDGTRIAFRAQADSGMSWQIMLLDEGLGPLAIPSQYFFDDTNLHWSPAGDAFVSDQGNFWQVCPNAKSSSEVCGDPAEIGSMATIRWIDGNRFLFVSGSVLFLYDREHGTSTPVATWPLEESRHPFSATLLP